MLSFISKQITGSLMIVNGSAVMLLGILGKYVVKKNSIPLDKLFIVNVLLFEAVLLISFSL